MEYGKYTKRMINFLSEFAAGEMELFYFDLDYSGRVVDWFPHMEDEDMELSEKFADIVDPAYELAYREGCGEEEFRERMKAALDDWLDWRDN